VSFLSGPTYPGIWPVILTITILTGLFFYQPLALVSIVLLLYLLFIVNKRTSCSVCESVVNRISTVSIAGMKSGYLPLLIFCLALLFVIFRDLSLLTQPRFWAEDGAHFFEFAYAHDWIETLLYRPEYQLILSNISALIASRAMPMELAPLPYSLVWLLNISAALAIIAWGSSSIWDTPLKKIIVSSIIIFAPRTYEIWLNANGSQYYSSLITALILCEPIVGAGKLKKYSFRVLLAIGSLNGVLSCLLTPLYWIRAYQNRDDKEATIQALILSTGLIIQLILIMTSSAHAERNILSSIGVFGWIASIRSFGLTFSMDLAEFLHQATKATASIPPDSRQFSVTGGLMAALWLAIIGMLAYRLRKQTAIYLLASYTLLFIFASIFGIAGPNNIYFLRPDHGDRYFFVPSVLILITMLSSIGPWSNGQLIRTWPIVASMLLGLGLINGIDQFYKQQLKNPAWPQWQHEVKIWKTEPRYVPHIWPDPWVVHLNKKAAE
jgi:hypothetical protein